MIAYGNVLFRYRNRLFPLFLAVLFIAFPLSWLRAGSELELYSDIGALVMGFVGESVRIATVGLDYIKRGGMNKRVYADQLVSTGMFAHCRNPLYLGNVIMAIALLVLFDNLWALAIGTIFTLTTYIAIVAAEEKYLRGRFGEAYERYCADVNRWLPSMAGLGDTFSGATFNWRRVLRKELTSFHSWMLFAVMVEGLDALFRGGGTLSDLVVFGIAYVIVVSAFLYGRTLKGPVD